LYLAGIRWTKTSDTRRRIEENKDGRFYRHSAPGLGLKSTMCKGELRGETFSGLSPNTIERLIMPIIHIVLVLIVVGILLWLVNSYIPMAASIKKILNVVVVVAVVLWLLSAFGILNSLSRFRA
jgi:hypothetical protein